MEIAVAATGCCSWRAKKDFGFFLKEKTLLKDPKEKSLLMLEPI
jgi:hypothetical protein